MSLISSVSSTVAAVATGLEPATTPTGGRLKGPASGLASQATPLALDALSAKLAAASNGKSSSAAAAKKSGTSRMSDGKTARSASATTRASTAKGGYASSTGAADFSFLKDARLSVEEKLFLFMCAIAKRNDDEVLKKMEEMKGGAAKAASSSGGSKKSGGLSIWSALKVLLPPLGMAAQMIGDAKLKSLLKEISGPVLAAAVTALGMPMLAPLALSAGSGLTGNLLDAKLGGDLLALGGDEARGGSSTSTSSGTSSSSSASATSGSGKNEQVQMMELQRLIDKQKEMFAMVSNILRAQHDTRMSIVGNIR